MRDSRSIPPVINCGAHGGEEDGGRDDPQRVERHVVMRARPENDDALHDDEQPADPEETLDLRVPTGARADVYLFDKFGAVVRRRAARDELEEIGEHRVEGTIGAAAEKKSGGGETSVPGGRDRWVLGGTKRK